MISSYVLADFLHRLNEACAQEPASVPAVTEEELEAFGKAVSYLQRCIEAAVNQQASLGLVRQLSEVCDRVTSERGFDMHIGVDTSFDPDAGQLTAQVTHRSPYGVALLNAYVGKVKGKARR